MFIHRVSRSQLLRLGPPLSGFRLGPIDQRILNKSLMMMGGIALYHATAPLLKSKGGSKNRKVSKQRKQDKHGGEELEVDDGRNKDIEELPDIEVICNGKQLRRIESLVKEFSRVRRGQVSADMFNHLQVKVHGGESVGILEVAQIVMKASGSKFNVIVFDPDLASSTAASIRDSGLGLNPTVEGNNIIVNIKQPSKETREALVKSLNQVTEMAKQDVRGIRKTALDKLKKVKRVREDEVTRLTKKVESYTEKNLMKITELLSEKTEQVLQK